LTITGTDAGSDSLDPQGESDSLPENNPLNHQLNPNEGIEDLPAQAELPLAYVAGEAITEAPKDLYIPPDALEIFLEAFEGPLDLLLYLIKRQNIDILEINVADITDQYMAYVELMHASQFELAAEYLVMAAMLAEIKSRILLPRQEEEEAEEGDPRMQLIRRLQEYERFKQAAEDINELPRMDRDYHRAKAAIPEIERITPDPAVDLQEILIALSGVLRRADMFEHHHIQFETLSTREKMSEIMVHLSGHKFVPLSSLLAKDEGRLGIVVTFLAVMELMKDSMVEIVQTDPFGPIHLKSRS
jgi:segregation and condensation protein A